MSADSVPPKPPASPQGERHLFLVRHAKSSWDRPGLKDIERPLNARGLRDAPTMAKRIAELLGDDGTAPRLILTSPAVRAESTARHFAAALGLPDAMVRRERGIYEASPETLQEIVFALDDDLPSVMIVGHNPGITSFVSSLSGSPVAHVPTCAVAGLRFAGDRWRSALPGRGVLRFLETPKHHRG